jgi:hypothetical protein
MSNKLKYTKEYLIDAGFDDSSKYVIKQTPISVEVDFDDKDAVDYIIEDIRKTKYKELFVVDYKKKQKRHTAIFFWLRED